jgi:putative acetyltransferase
MNIIPYKEEYHARVLVSWERSVRATHHFLDPKDFEEIKALVQTIDFNAFPVFCLIENDTVLGFMAVVERKVEMLFLDAEQIGKGYGKTLMNHAVQKLGAVKVDVNEQNEAAVNFYQKLGFEAFERTTHDDQGKPYPLLRLRLKI